jgi:hypothetical protein
MGCPCVKAELLRVKDMVSSSVEAGADAVHEEIIKANIIKRMTILMIHLHARHCEQRTQ